MIASAKVPKSEIGAGKIETEARPPGLNSMHGYGLAIERAAHLSREALLTVSTPCHLSVVVPVYGDKTRLCESYGNPDAKNWLRLKLGQLKELTAGTMCTSSLHFIDDGSPDGAGFALRELVRSHGIRDVTVELLGEAIARGKGPLGQMKSDADSAKGGSVLYGLWAAATSYSSESGRRQVLLTTDVDNQIDLRQAGPFVESIVQRGSHLAIGTRYGEGSYFEIGARHLRVTDAYWQIRSGMRRMFFPCTAEIFDSQVPFKAFSQSSALILSQRVLERGLAFDMELLQKFRSGYGRLADVLPVVGLRHAEEVGTFSLGGWSRVLRSMGNAFLTIDLEEKPEHLLRVARLVSQIDSRSLVKLLRETAKHGKGTVLTSEDVLSIFDNSLGTIA